MKIVIPGGRGMLGRDLMAACRTRGVEAVALDLPELDITRADGAGWAAVPDCDWVVNCAAYTNVDGAETQRELAFAVNRDGVANLAGWCRSRGTPLLHISTDYVFDGREGVAYREEDPPRPLNVYGESKLAGEQVLRAAWADHLIVRTQSLFGIHGNSFVGAIMKRLERGDRLLDVVSDQVSSPTYTGHLAEAILHLLATGKRGIVHVSAAGECSWAEFARAIAARVCPAAQIKEISADTLARPARRPPYSVLDKRRYTEWTGRALPDWRAGLDAYGRESGRKP